LLGYISEITRPVGEIDAITLASSNLYERENEQSY